MARYQVIRWDDKMFQVIDRMADDRPITFNVGYDQAKAMAKVLNDMEPLEDGVYYLPSTGERKIDFLVLRAGIWYNVFGRRLVTCPEPGAVDVEASRVGDIPRTFKFHDVEL